MTNIFFPDEQISKDDVYFVCYMTERLARKLKQPKKYIVNVMGHDELAKKLSLADTLHSANPLAIEADWTNEYNLQSGNYDVTKVDHDLCSNIPTSTQMGKVYKRLIIDTMQPGEDYADAMLRVYNDPICDIIDNYNTSAYYEPSQYIARSYYSGSF